MMREQADAPLRFMDGRDARGGKTIDYREVRAFDILHHHAHASISFGIARARW
jgi:hypothetical protein